MVDVICRFLAVLRKLAVFAAALRPVDDDPTKVGGDVKVLRGAPFGMTEAAVEAVRGWRFRPATREGEPVAVYYQLTVRFRPVR